MGGTYVDLNQDTYMWQWFCDCEQRFYGRAFDMFEKAMYVKAFYKDPRHMTSCDWDSISETIEQEFKEDRVKAIKEVEKDRKTSLEYLIGEWASFNGYVSN